MALQITDRFQVGLNGLKYTIAGQVHSQRVSRNPPKMITGSAEYANEQFLSNWITKDQRGGLLVEEMDESVDADRYWWSTCDTRFPGHLIPNQLATEIPIPNWTSPTGFTDAEAAWTNETNIFDDNTSTVGTCSVAGSQWGDYLELDITSATVISVAIYIATVDTDITQVDIDYYDGSWNDIYEGVISYDAWMTKALSSITASVTKVRIRLFNSTAGTKNPTVSEVYIGVDDYSGTVKRFKEFNSTTYIAASAWLNKLDSGETFYEFIRKFGEESITDLEIAFGELIITLGDDDEYYHMDTSESFTISGDANNTDQWTKCIYWSGKLYGCQSDGTMTSCTTAGGNTTAADASGGLDELVDDNDLNRLFRYRDAAGTDIIYAATKKGLYAFDSANGKWLRTELKLPNHPNGGAGAVVFNDAAYISSGLDVKSYQTGQSRATIVSAGLSQRDGLPNEYIGEITYFIEGYDEFYALVDSSQSSGTTTSGVYASDGRRWRNLWIAGSTETAMTSGILTTSPSVLLLFDSGSTTYKIPIQRTFQNPKKDSSYTYTASAVHISPWFDADTAVYDKLAKAINTYAKDITTNETVAIKYRTNKTNTDIATGWTTLDTLNTSGENGQNEEKLGTNAGEVVETIQLRLDLARGSTNTLAPDVQAVVLAYQKLIDQIWSWSFRVIIDGQHDTTAKEKAENLISAIESQTIIECIYRRDDSTETKYVKIFTPRGTTETGDYYEGDYVLTAIEI